MQTMPLTAPRPMTAEFLDLLAELVQEAFNLAARGRISPADADTLARHVRCCRERLADPLTVLRPDDEPFAVRYADLALAWWRYLAESSTPTRRPLAPPADGRVGPGPDPFLKPVDSGPARSRPWHMAPVAPVWEREMPARSRRRRHIDDDTAGMVCPGCAVSPCECSGWAETLTREVARELVPVRSAPEPEAPAPVAKAAPPKARPCAPSPEAQTVAVRIAPKAAPHGPDRALARRIAEDWLAAEWRWRHGR